MVLSSMSKLKYKNNIIAILFVLLVISGYSNYKFFQLNRYYKKLIPYMIRGESLKNAQLLDETGQLIDSSILKKGVSIIFVFLKECSPCDTNITFWKKIAKVFKDKVSIYGIILNTPTDALNFSEKAKLNFKIFVPDKLEQLISDWKLQSKFSQTIVLKDGKVSLLTYGKLDGDSTKQIVKEVRGLIK